MTISADVVQGAMITKRGQGKRVHVLGAEIAISIPTQATGGSFSVFEGWTKPLQGPPLHRHRDHDEWWYILDGAFRFEVDGQEIYAATGDTVFAAKGSRHTFQNIGATVGHTVTTVVPGGIDVFFEELETVAPRGTAPDRAKLLPVFEKHGQELLGPPISARSAAPATI